MARPKKASRATMAAERLVEVISRGIVVPLTNSFGHGTVGPYHEAVGGKKFALIVDTDRARGPGRFVYGQAMWAADHAVTNYGVANVIDAIKKVARQHGGEYTNLETPIFSRARRRNSGEEWSTPNQGFNSRQNPRIHGEDRLSPAQLRYWRAQERKLAAAGWAPTDVVDPHRTALREMRAEFSKGTRVYRASTGGKWGKSAQRVRLNPTGRKLVGLGGVGRTTARTRMQAAQRGFGPRKGVTSSTQKKVLWKKLQSLHREAQTHAVHDVAADLQDRFLRHTNGWDFFATDQLRAAVKHYQDAMADFARWFRNPRGRR